MGETIDRTGVGITAAIARLRRNHTDILALMPQAEVVNRLAALARLWRDPAYALRREAEKWQQPFPFKMVEVSLDALLHSLTPEALWALVDAEDVRDAQGYPVIGHVIAGNTPLLAWVSIIRALLVRSASFVKLPSGPAAEWGRLFGRTMADVSPELAACVHLDQWPGGTTELDAALCAGADLVIAHGGDVTMRALRALCPAGTPFVGYGHRVSFGLVTRGNGTAEAAAGFAEDVLLYDQGGCLSPQTIFVEGDWKEAPAFAARLADALPQAASAYPLPVRDERAAQAVREARGLAWMGQGNRLWEDPGLRWTVIARPQPVFAPSPTFGVVSVQPLETLEHLPEAVAPVAAYLQGCAVAGEAGDYLPGVSYLCAPGELQAPPLSWRQDGRDVLRILTPPHPYRADGSTTTCVSDGNVSGETSSIEEE
jgi:hypothetical protein